MTEDSTPFAEIAEETTEQVLAENTAADTVPEADFSEADETAEAAKEPQQKLWAGKFKTVEDLEKSYKEAESYVHKSRELEKQLEAFQKAEEAFRINQDYQIMQQMADSELEKQMAADVIGFELNCFREALESGQATDYQQAKEALQRFEQSGDMQELKKAKRFFDPDALASIAKRSFVFEQHKMQDFSLQQQKNTLQRLKQKISDFVKEDPSWFEKHGQDRLVADAIGALGENLDWERLKSAVSEIEEKAVENYLHGVSLKSENDSQKQLLQIPKSGSDVVNNGNGWITRAEYNAMSDKETYEKYDQIVRQIQLEKEGKLPTMLT